VASTLSLMLVYRIITHQWRRTVRHRHEWANVHIHFNRSGRHGDGLRGFLATLHWRLAVSEHTERCLPGSRRLVFAVRWTRDRNRSRTLCTRRPGRAGAATLLQRRPMCISPRLRGQRADARTRSLRVATRYRCNLYIRHRHVHDHGRHAARVDAESGKVIVCGDRASAITIDITSEVVRRQHTHRRRET
jgi:hypothetical protein